MHANRIFFLSIIFIGFVVLIQAQNNCPCLHENSGARWISNTPVAESCIINSNNTVERICQLASGDLVNCSVQLNCTDSSSTSNWTPWTNIGNCNASCGSGIQMQARSCYMTLEGYPSRNISSTKCTGSYGQVEQTRQQTCTRFQPNCNPYNLYARPPATTTTTTTTTVSPTIMISTTTPITNLIDQTDSTIVDLIDQTNSTTVDLIDQTNSTTVDTKNTKTITGNDETKNDPTNGIHILAFGLGSLVLLCITIIIVMLIVVKRRRPKTLLVRETQFQPHFSHLTSGEYEEIGPALPPRNSCDEVSIVFVSMDQQSPAKNSKASIKIEQDESGYLIPTINPLQAITDENNYLQLTNDANPSDQSYE